MTISFVCFAATLSQKGRGRRQNADINNDFKEELSDPLDFFCESEDRAFDESYGHSVNKIGDREKNILPAQSCYLRLLAYYLHPPNHLKPLTPPQQSQQRCLFITFPSKTQRGI